MSGLPVVSLDEEIQFIKSVVFPSFGFDEEKREHWMRLKAERHLPVDEANELMDRCSTIFTLEKAENKLLVLNSEQERQQ
jgi:hypothetical protein